ncbi:MAG: hypothetical protein ABH843_06885 [Candidatus Omnitrophota bacterium]
MRKKLIRIIVILVVFTLSTEPLYANERKKRKGGTMKRLSVIGDNIDSQNETWKLETENYRKAEGLIGSSAIKQGITKDFISEICGSPAAEAWDGAKWVYKPSSSTYFKGEKIYFLFDEDGKLIEWERVLQK